MEIYECKHKVKCDFAGCHNVAKFTFVKKSILRRDICLCEECVNELYDAVTKIKVPRAVASPFKLNKRLKSDEK